MWLGFLFCNSFRVDVLLGKDTEDVVDRYASSRSGTVLEGRWCFLESVVAKPIVVKCRTVSEFDEGFLLKFE